MWNILVILFLGTELFVNAEQKAEPSYYDPHLAHHIPHTGAGPTGLSYRNNHINSVEGYFPQNDPHHVTYDQQPQLVNVEQGNPIVGRQVNPQNELNHVTYNNQQPQLVNVELRGNPLEGNPLQGNPILGRQVSGPGDNNVNLTSIQGGGGFWPQQNGFYHPPGFQPHLGNPVVGRQVSGPGDNANLTSVQVQPGGGAYWPLQQGGFHHPPGFYPNGGVTYRTEPPNSNNLYGLSAFPNISPATTTAAPQMRNQVKSRQQQRTTMTTTTTTTTEVPERRSNFRRPTPNKMKKAGRRSETLPKRKSQPMRKSQRKRKKLKSQENGDDDVYNQFNFSYIPEEFLEKGTPIQPTLEIVRNEHGIPIVIPVFRPMPQENNRTTSNRKQKKKSQRQQNQNQPPTTTSQYFAPGFNSYSQGPFTIQLSPFGNLQNNNPLQNSFVSRDVLQQTLNQTGPGLGIFGWNPAIRTSPFPHPITVGHHPVPYPYSQTNFGWGGTPIYFTNSTTEQGQPPVAKTASQEQKKKSQPQKERNKPKPGKMTSSTKNKDQDEDITDEDDNNDIKENNNDEEVKEVEEEEEDPKTVEEEDTKNKGGEENEEDEYDDEETDDNNEEDKKKMEKNTRNQNPGDDDDEDEEEEDEDNETEVTNKMNKTAMRAKPIMQKDEDNYVDTEEVSEEIPPDMLKQMIEEYNDKNKDTPIAQDGDQGQRIAERLRNQIQGLLDAFAARARDSAGTPGRNHTADHIEWNRMLRERYQLKTRVNVNSNQLKQLSDSAALLNDM